MYKNKKKIQYTMLRAGDFEVILGDFLFVFISLCFPNFIL